MVVKWNDLYAYNSRIKAFLPSVARNKVAELAMTDLEHVIRIQTDNCCFDRPQNISKYDDLKLEDKTTGKIYFRNCNKYIKVEEGQHYEVGDRIDKYKEQKEMCSEVFEYEEDEDDEENE